MTGNWIHIHQPTPHRAAGPVWQMAFTAGLLAIVMTPAGAAIAQDATWQPRSVEMEGRSETESCRKARAEAAETARAHLGLNIKSCTCRQAETKEGGGYRCRLDFEVLVRE